MNLGFFRRHLGKRLAVLIRALHAAEVGALAGARAGDEEAHVLRLRLRRTAPHRTAPHKPASVSATAVATTLRFIYSSWKNFWMIQ